MRDEIDGRMWVEHGTDFCEQIRQVARSLARGWSRLNAIQFDAPWRRNRNPGCA